MSAWTYATAVGFQIVAADQLCYAFNRKHNLLGSGQALRPAEDCEAATSPSGRVWYSVAEAQGEYGLAQVGWITADSFFNFRFELILPDGSDNDDEFGA
jgi:hypothetical protein